MVGTILCTYLVLLVCLNLRPIKNLWIGEIEQSVSSLLHSKVEIKDVEVGLFNRIVLHDLTVYDQNEEVLLSSKKFSAKILLRDLLKSKISLRSVLLMDTDVHLYQVAKDSAYNFQYIVDLFQTSEDASTQTQLKIGSLIVTRANVSCDKRWMPKPAQGFSKDHIALNDIHANLSVNIINNDSIHLRVRKFACTESCGFAINNVRFNAEIGKSGITLDKTRISLPHSDIIAEAPISISFDQKQLPLINGDILIKSLSSQDFEFLTPYLNNLDFNLNGGVKINHNEGIKHVIISLKEQKSHFNLDIDSDIKDNHQFNVNLKHLEADSIFLTQIVSLIPNKDVQRLRNLGHVSATGNATYDIKSSNGQGQVDLQSPSAGVINIKGTLQDEALNVNLATKETNLKALLEADYLPETLNATAQVKAILKDSTLAPKQLSLQIASAINQQYYDLEDIATTVEMNNHNVKCDVESNHPDLLLTLKASCTYRNKTLSDLNLNGKLKNINISKLGVTDSTISGIWRGMIHLNAPAITENKCKLHLTIDSLVAQRLVQPFKMKKCDASLDYTKNQHSTLKLKSDFISVNAEGVIDYATVLDTWKSTLTQHIPSLKSTTSIKQTKDKNDEKNAMSFMVYLHDGRFAHNVFFLPIEMSDGSTIQGKLFKDDTHAKLSAFAEKVKYENHELENVSLHLQSKDSSAGLLVQAKKQMMNDNIQFVLGAQLHDDLLETNLEWDGVKHHKFSGSLNTMTSFLDDNTIRSSVLPTTIHIEDSIWNVSKGEFLFSGKDHKIKNLTLNTSHQSITLNGGLSSTKDDSLHLKLKNINVGYILDKINFRSVLFDGAASGDAYLSITPGKPFLTTNLHVKSFLFNKAPFGDAKLHATWDSPKEPINVVGNFEQKDISSTRAIGHIWPSKNSIDLQITTNKTNIAFLRKWVNNIVRDITGNTTGYCRLHGTFNKLDLSGNMQINAAFDVPANGVSYQLENAKVAISSGLFTLQNATLKALKGGTGLAQAQLKHNHFKNFFYDLNVTSNGLLLYDKGRTPDMPFYATTYANGTIQINGSPTQLTLNVDATPTNNSLIVYTENEILATHNSNDGVINYRNARKDAASQDVNLPLITMVPTPQMDMNFHFNVNMNSAATLRVLMDEVTGDHLNLVGNGILSADYYNKGAFRLHGNYALTGGNYQMSIQDVLKKNFEIQNGSSIIFGGNPDEAQLALKAIYTVPTASLADLNIGENFSDRNIKANCILNIGGTASNPNVSFDLDLPNINDDEKQMVRKLIATEEDMNMQVIHLLALGRFYTYDYTVTESNQQSQSTVVANSFLSSTLSSRINDVISNALGSNDWNFGTNFTTGTTGWTDMEVDGIISGKLMNNRLLLNGNVGYHENKYNAMRGSNFVGDFDVKYLLNPNGGILLKAYSETNDRYFTKSALTTQGVGIQFQKDFTNLKELFTKSKKTPTMNEVPPAESDSTLEVKDIQ
ncbi:MAG: translocation/assembly module TamB [Bacteroidaceae bacterium]|nr:translocation/assembly module TamB [Bacteroidaceae bacterium]